MAALRKNKQGRLFPCVLLTVFCDVCTVKPYFFHGGGRVCLSTVRARPDLPSATRKLQTIKE